MPCLATARPALCVHSPHTEGGPPAVPARMVHAVALQRVDGPPGPWLPALSQGQSSHQRCLAVPIGRFFCNAQDLLQERPAPPV